MAQPTNAYSAYDAGGASGVGRANREDLANVVYDISPTETPVLSMLPRAKATATFHEWTTDALATAAANAQIEGDDTAATAPQARSRFGNYTQISKKVVVVTGTQQEVTKAGIEDEMAYQMAKTMKEIKRDIEISLTANTARVQGNDTTARVSAGFLTWMSVNSDRGASGANPTGDGSDTATNGTQRALTENQVLAVSQSCYTNGGNPTKLVVGAFNKRIASGFAGNQNRNIDASEKKIIYAVDVYATDFHTLQIIPDRFSSSRDAMLIDPEYAKVAYLRPFKTEDLGKTGDSIKKHIFAEWCLEMSNRGAHGVVADLTTS